MEMLTQDISSFSQRFVKQRLHSIVGLTEEFESAEQRGTNLPIEVQEIKAEQTNPDFDIFDLDILPFSATKLLEWQKLHGGAIKGDGFAVKDEGCRVAFDGLLNDCRPHLTEEPIRSICQSHTFGSWSKISGYLALISSEFLLKMWMVPSSSL